MKKIALIILLTSLLAMQFCTTENQIINNLKVEYTATPLGIDVENPLFSWQMALSDNMRGQYQTAYQIVITNPAGEIVWDTKKIESAEALAIKYEGSPLKAATKYSWTVTVWDQDNSEHSASSWFETGLMNTEESAWNGAQWIGGGDDDLVLYSQYLLIYKMKYSVAIAEGSTKAGFVYGANDWRLMDKYKNIYQIENKINESYIKLELDISDVESHGGLAKLNVYRAGYAPGDSPDTPFKAFEIKSSVINSGNKNEKHQFDITSEFGRAFILLDGNDKFYVEKEKGADLPPWLIGAPGASVPLNPLGTGGDYLPFGMVCEMGFAVDAGQKAAFSDVEVLNHRMPNNTLFKEDLSSDYDGIYKGLVGVENNSYIVDGGEKGTFVVADPSRNSTPMLRTEFEATKKIQSARLYVTARGIYEIQINGEKVGNDYYNPGQTQYNKTHYYQTYDVANMLNNGPNAMGAMLAEGWWSGLLSFGNAWNHFGDRQSLLANLVITYVDGSKENIITNSKDWKYYNNGPIVYSSLNLGEIYDATKEKEIEGWSTAGFDDSAWKKATEIPLEGTSYKGVIADFDGTSGDFDFENVELVGQVGNNAGEYTTLTAKSVEEVREGVFVYDMGQNFVGVPKISIADGSEGDTIVLRVAEMLYPDLEESGDNVGMLMIENYRAAMCTDKYIMKEGEQVFQPKFTSRGYQFLEITGIDKPLPIEAVQGVAISSVLELTADYKTSNKKVNQLWSNLVWSNIDNFLTIPTDCPQRNERMGWSGDISVFSRSATYISNSDQFLKRHMVAMRDIQRENGKFTDVAPIGGGFGGVLWGSAGITVAWEVYQQYKDISLLVEHYDAMVAYVDYLETTLDPETGFTSDGQLGDWLGPQNNQLGTPFLTTAYHIFDLWIMKNVATLLGKNEDAARFEAYYNRQKELFNNTFISEEGKSLGLVGGGIGFGYNVGKLELKLADTQTSYAVGLALNAFDEKYMAQMAKNLAETVARKNIDDEGIERPEYSLMTGFIGTAWVSNALSDFGYDEHAYKLLQSEHYPSWLYTINQGATTIWERLNGYTVENGFGGNNRMNSFNHYSFGAVGQWMIAYSLGIQRDEAGFRKFILQPTPDPTGEMTWAEGYYESMYGKIYSKWEVKDGNFIYEATVPANTSTTLYLPAKSESDVIDADGCTLVKFEGGKAVYLLQSGKYRFESKL